MTDINLQFGIDNVWSEDAKFQEDVLKGILRKIRNVENEDFVERDFQYLKSLGVFFIPGDTYLIEHFGELITDNTIGLYIKQKDELICTIADRLAIPMRLMTGEVFSFVGYESIDDDEIDYIKYMYPSKMVYKKGNYVFTTGEEYKRAIQDGYVFLVDGLFDKIRLETYGYNALSFCGSAITPMHRLYLQFVRHKIVLPDNDAAGAKLSRYCRSVLDHCVELRQGKTKDIDDFLKNPANMEAFDAAFGKMRGSRFLYSVTIRGEFADDRRDEALTETSISMV